jgi:hypothetical protein
MNPDVQAAITRKKAISEVLIGAAPIVALGGAAWWIAKGRSTPVAVKIATPAAFAAIAWYGLLLTAGFSK